MFRDRTLDNLFYYVEISKFEATNDDIAVVRELDIHDENEWEELEPID